MAEMDQLEAQIAQMLVLHRDGEALVLWHRTPAAKEILADGWKDGGSDGMRSAMAKPELGAGVYVSNRPLDSDEGTKGKELLRVLLAATEEAIAEFEIIEEGKPYREWCLSAALLNQNATTELRSLIDEPGGQQPPANESAALRATAFHEAGHAVAAMALGISFTHITIGLNGADLGGVTFVGPEWLDPDAVTLSALIATLYAGRIAESRFTGRTARRGALSDYESVRALADSFLETDDREASLKKARHRAEEVIDSHWTKVERLADALLRRTRLAHDEALTELGEG